MKQTTKIASGIGVTVGGILMVIGYTLGKIYVYSTLEYAIIKLPYEIAQAALGAVFGMLLCWTFRIGKLYHRFADSPKAST